MEVVRLEQLEEEPPSEQGGSSFRPYAGLLAESRNQIAERVGAAIAASFDALEEQFRTRRAAAASEDQRIRLAALQKVLRSHGRDLVQRFRESFERGFRRRTVGQRVERSSFDATVSSMMEWSLADDDQISDELMVQNLARDFAIAADAVRKELRPRVAHMLDDPALEEDDDPLGPLTLSEALKEACWALDLDREAKVELLESIGASLRQPLAKAYGELNVFLLARKVVPRVRHAVKRSTPPISARESVRAGPEGRAPTEQETSSILQRLFAPGTDAAAGGAAAPLAVRMATTNLGVLKALTQLQRGEEGVALGSDRFDLALGAGDGEATNLVRSLIDKGIGRHVGSVDGIIIDVVAALFDYIFDDPHVPGAMKGLIGRLQIPVLKLAMMDHSFFSNRVHPARRLINTLAQASAGWDGTFSSESSLYRFAEPVVVEIQNGFAENREIFSAALTRIEAFIADLERSEDAQVEQLSEELEQRERLEIATVVARNATASHLANQALPEPVRRFIAEVWFKVLVKAAMAGSDDGAEWQDAARAMDDLAWSVQPMQGPEERQRLLKTLPPMLKAISGGIGQIEVAPGTKEAFFAELMKLHAAAVKAGMASPPASPSAAPAKAASAAPEPGPLPEPCASVRELARGTWLTIQEAGGDSRRVRLSWISPARTMFLFTNHQGERALALTHHELARRLESGSVRLADSQPLLDRVVDIVLDDFEGHH